MPCVYGIVINMKVVTGDEENVLKQVKVGKTTVDTSQERTEWRLY